MTDWVRDLVGVSALVLLPWARIRQGLLAGAASGAVAGLVLTNFLAIAVFMMVLGPLLGAAGGALGGAVAASHPGRPRPARSWAAGMFVRS